MGPCTQAGDAHGLILWPFSGPGGENYVVCEKKARFEMRVFPVPADIFIIPPGYQISKHAAGTVPG